MLESGTNQFHGSLYEYNRVSALAARSFFNRAPNPVASTTYNYYWGAIGGPIIKDKTFFFSDLLRISEVRGQFNQESVPTDTFGSGDFRGQPAIYDPTTGNPNGTGGAQFSCNGVLNVICPKRISPIAQRVLALVPHANRPGLITGIQHEQSGANNETHIFSPTLVMETRAGISHYRNIAHSADYGSKASDALGIPGVNLDNFTSGLVGIRILSINSNDPLIGYSASLPGIAVKPTSTLSTFGRKPMSSDHTRFHPPCSAAARIHAAIEAHPVCRVRF